jgi:uncharacterized membrane protein
MMFIFLASVGATADIWQLVAIGPVLFVYASVIVIVHTIVLFSAGRLLKLDLAELAMASAVCIHPARLHSLPQRAGATC